MSKKIYVIKRSENLEKFKKKMFVFYLNIFNIFSEILNLFGLYVFCLNVNRTDNILLLQFVYT